MFKLVLVKWWLELTKKWVQFLLEKVSTMGGGKGD